MMGRPRIFAGRVIFDHLPKTAGSAVTSWLTERLGSGCVIANQGDNHQDLIRRYGGAYPVISAHIHFDGEGLNPLYQYIANLREPLDRAISWLFFVVNNHVPNQLPDVWEQAKCFIDSEGEVLGKYIEGHISNVFVEHFAKVTSTAPCSEQQRLANALGVIEQYDVWGFYEDLPTFLEDVAALIGLPVPRQIERINLTRARPAVEQISPLLRKNLEALNALDLEFYSILRERWQRERNLKSTIKSPDLLPWEAYNPKQKPAEELLPGRMFGAPEFNLLSVVIEGSDPFFLRGQILLFTVEFSLARAIDELVIGVHVFDEDGRWAFGTNTSMLGRPLRQLSCGTHRMRYYLVADFPEGKYTVGFAFVEHCMEGDHELAWYDKLVTFWVSVPRLTPSMGYLSMPVEFDYRYTSDVVVNLIENAAGTLVSDTVMSDVAVRETFDLRVRLENDSSQTWVSIMFNPINLSYHWHDQAGNPVVFDGLRTPLPVSEVRPGQMVTAQMRVLAPNAPGRYRLVLLPVQEMRYWFDDLGFTPGVLEIDVVA